MISFSFFIRFCHYNKQFCDSQVEHFSDSWGRQKQIQNLNSVQGALLGMNRSIQAEETFGSIKWKRKYQRLHRRGI